MKRKSIIKNGDEIHIKEPIIMRLANNGETKSLFENIDENNIYKEGYNLIIENPSAELLVYFQKWITLIRNPQTGECDYPEILNINRSELYEYIEIRNITDHRIYDYVPLRIVYGDTTKLVFDIFHRLLV